MAQAKAQTLLTEINQTYETPGGIRIHMQGGSRTPSGGSLEFTTKLTPEAAGRAVNGQSGFHKLNFHLEDEQGNWLGDSRVFEIGRRSELERWSGVTQWFYQFNNFAYDQQKIRFVMNSYVIRENSEASVTFDPAKISAEHPVKLEDSGDRLAYDENGKEYSVHFAGGISSDKSGVVGLEDDACFIINGLDTMPKQLTLKRTIVNHQYKDADWSFVIPQTGTKGVIPE